MHTVRKHPLILSAGVLISVLLLLLLLATVLCFTACDSSDGRHVEDSLYITCPDKAPDTCSVRAFSTEENGYIVVLPSDWTPDALMAANRDDRYTLRIDGLTVPAEGTALSVTPDTAYPLTVSDRSGKTVVDATVTFTRSQLPSLSINTASGSMDAIHADKEYREEGMIRVTDTDGSVQYNGKLAWIHGRGNSTWTLRKKPYNIKFPQKVKILGLEGKKFTLLANFMDRSELRNWVSLKAVLDSGYPNAVNGAYVSVWLNGEFNGVYLMTEKIGIDKYSIPITEQKEPTLTGNETRWTVGENGQPGSAKGLAIHSPAGADITGGYLLELFLDERYEQEVSGFVSEHGQHIVIKSPENPTVEQVEYIRAYYQRIENALLSPDSTDPETGIPLDALIDVDSFAAMYLFEELTGDLDAGEYSIFLYKDTDSKDGKLYAGPLWDFDLTLGNELLCAPYAVADWPVSYTYCAGKTELLYELRENETIRHAVREQYAAGLGEYLRKWAIGERFDTMADAIRHDVKMDYLRWNLHGDFDEAIADMQAYVTDHLAFLDDFLSGDVTYCHVAVNTGKGQNIKIDQYHYAIPLGGTVTLPFDYSQEEDFLGWFIRGTDTPFDPSVPVTGDLSVEGRRQVRVTDRLTQFATRVWHRLEPHMGVLLPVSMLSVGGVVCGIVFAVRKKKRSAAG